MAESNLRSPLVHDIVLIHGAWQGAWAFDAWAPLLRERGWRVHAVDLPAGLGDGLDVCTDSVVALVQRLDTPVVLVGHSGGGLTASQVAQAIPDRIACLVYLAGFMLPSGMTFVDLLEHCRAQAPGVNFDGIAPHLQWNEDRNATRVSIEGALNIFLHDCDPGEARRAAEHLREQPEAGRAMRNELTADRFGRVPRIYVECTDDRSIALPLQRAMQALSPGAVLLSLSCGHVPQLARPLELTERLLPIIASLTGTPIASA